MLLLCLLLKLLRLRVGNIVAILVVVLVDNTISGGWDSSPTVVLTVYIDRLRPFAQPARRLV